ncbi:MAG: primosomal replication protein N [Rhodocyclaceae bacterium]
MGVTGTNLVRIAGVLKEREALRMTPARIPVLQFRLQHESTQVELEVERKTSCELGALAMGPLAQQLAAMPMGVAMVVEGFLAARSAKNQNPVLHVQKFELLDSSPKLEGTT